MTKQEPILLILRPQPHWGIVSADLRRVAALGRYMITGRAVRGCQDDGGAGGGRQGGDNGCQTAAADGSPTAALATLCEGLRADSLYARYANKKLFRREADFWATADTAVRQHVKRMADRKLIEAVQTAARLDIPMLYAPKADSALHIEDRLHLKAGAAVTPVMHFSRHDGGISYRLQLRTDDGATLTPSDHRVAVLAYEPGLFIVDHDLLLLDDSFSGKLLLPFVGKSVIEIPRHLENDYFRRFILRHVAKAEIHADGFDIADISQPLRPRLVLETGIDGAHLLSLHFCYGDNDYTPDSAQRGRVRLNEVDGSYRFTRQLRDMAAERAYTALLAETGQMSSRSGFLRFASLSSLLAWLQSNGSRLRRQGFDVLQPTDHPYYIGPLDVEQSDTWRGDWLQTEVSIVLDGGRLRIPFTDLRDTILHGEAEYLLPTGERLLIPEEWLQRYGDLLLVANAKDGKFVRHRCQVGNGGDAASSVEDGGFAAAVPSPSGADEGTAAAKPPFPTPHSLKCQLRPYQVTGYQWLWRNFEAQTGCCLSDEMGLGKTLQTIALLLTYKEVCSTPIRQQPPPGLLFTEEEMSGVTAHGSQSTAHRSDFKVPFLPSLVVAPASVVHNWQNELRRFAPQLSVCSYTGDTTQRRAKRQGLMRCDVVLTTYRTLQNDVAWLCAQQFGIVVFDESQAFKTATSLTHQAVSSLTALHRMALSGTPVENNLGELWSLMSVLNPCLLGSWHNFQASFANPIASRLETERTQVLRRLIAPYFLRRTKEEVLSDLPERQDEVVVCPMTGEQQHSYAEELSRARNEWLEADAADSHRSIHLLTALQRLRQIANGAGKMSAVFERLEQLRGTHHKVLLFSEYVSLLERVGQEMSQRGWHYDLLTGQTRQREAVIAHFQQTQDCQFFLISLKAGGVGLNLTAADYVFLLDPWWNLAAEEQAIARAHRIGQHRPVFVYRFVSENTLEQQILTLQQRKQTLIDSVMPFMGLAQ